LLESITSDDESLTSIDDTDNNGYYTPKIQNPNNVIEESRDLSDYGVRSNIEILKLFKNCFIDYHN